MNNRRLASTMLALQMFSGGLRNKTSNNPQPKFERTKMKGSAGVYNKEKHMSRVERKQKGIKNPKK